MYFVHSHSTTDNTYTDNHFKTGSEALRFYNTITNPCTKFIVDGIGQVLLKEVEKKAA